MFSTICRDNLKAVVKAYGQATGQGVTAISKKFYGNSAFLPAFFAGDQSISIDKLDGMFKAIISTWPEDARWPPLRAIIIKGPDNIIPKKPSPPLVRTPANRIDAGDASPRRRAR